MIWRPIGFSDCGGGDDYCYYYDNDNDDENYNYDYTDDLGDNWFRHRHIFYVLFFLSLGIAGHTSQGHYQLRDSGFCNG